MPGGERVSTWLLSDGEEFSAARVMQVRGREKVERRVGRAGLQDQVGAGD